MSLSINVTGEDIAYYPSDVPIPTYNGAGFAANTGPYLNWYRGAGPAPRKGRPALVKIVGGGYVSSTRDDTALDTDSSDFRLRLAAEFCRQGGNYFSVSITHGSGTLVASGVTSHGLHHPPGKFLSALGTSPYENPAYAMGYKDAIHAIQHIKKNADTYGIDPDRIIMSGDSYSGHCVEWACYKERRNELGSVSTDSQYGYSTRAAFLILYHPLVRWQVFDQAAATGKVFPDKTNPDGKWNTPITSLSDSPADYLTSLDVLGPNGYADLSIVQTTPLHVSTGANETESSAGAVTTANYKYPFSASNTEPIHSAWNAACFRDYIERAPVRFAAGASMVQVANSVSNEDFNFTDTSQLLRARSLVSDQRTFLDTFFFAGRPALGING